MTMIDLVGFSRATVYNHILSQGSQITNTTENTIQPQYLYQSFANYGFKQVSDCHLIFGKPVGFVNDNFLSKWITQKQRQCKYIGSECVPCLHRNRLGVVWCRCVVLTMSLLAKMYFFLFYSVSKGVSKGQPQNWTLVEKYFCLDWHHHQTGPLK